MASQIDTRTFSGALVDGPTPLVTEPVTAIYVDGRLDRIEWSHTGKDGRTFREVVPASHIARLFVLEPD